MKNSLFVIAGLLIVIWGIVFYGLHAVGPVHFLLVIVAIALIMKVTEGKKVDWSKIKQNL